MSDIIRKFTLPTKKTDTVYHVKRLKHEIYGHIKPEWAKPVVYLQVFAALWDRHICQSAGLRFVGEWRNGEW